MVKDNFLATNSIQRVFLITAGLHNPDENVYLYSSYINPKYPGDALE